MGFETLIGRITGKTERDRKMTELRSILQQRADEHNAKVNLAYQREQHAINLLLSSPRLWPLLDEIGPIVNDIIYATKVRNDGMWVTSFIESDGNLLRSWDLKDEKEARERELWLTRTTENNT